MTVDRIEEDFAVVFDNENRINIPLSKLPKGIKEGDIINKAGLIDKEETIRIRSLNVSRLKKLKGE